MESTSSIYSGLTFWVWFGTAVITFACVKESKFRFFPWWGIPAGIIGIGLQNYYASTFPESLPAIWQSGILQAFYIIGGFAALQLLILGLLKFSGHSWQDKPDMMAAHHAARQLEEQENLAKYAILYPKGLEFALSHELKKAMEHSNRGELVEEAAETARVYARFNARIVKGTNEEYKQRNELKETLRAFQDGRRLAYGSTLLAKFEIGCNDEINWLELRSDRILVDFRTYPITPNTKVEVFVNGQRQVNYTTTNIRDVNLHIDDDREYVLHCSDSNWKFTVKSEWDEDEWPAANAEMRHLQSEDLESFREFALQLNSLTAKMKEERSGLVPAEFSDVSRIDKVIELKKLFDSGLISQQEFKDLKDSLFL